MRRVTALAAMAVAMALLAAGAASAGPIQVLPEPIPEEPAPGDCGEVSIAAHVVSGGCHTELESTGTGFQAHAYIPFKTTFIFCEVNLEAQIGTDGEGYVTQAVLSAPHVGSNPCNRVPCDEADGTFRPWRLHIREFGEGNEEAELTLCLRLISEGPGAAGGTCEAHMRFTDLGNHRYEAGEIVAGPLQEPVEQFCENNPPNNPAPHPGLMFPISIEPHFVTPASFETEEVEITHE